MAEVEHVTGFLELYYTPKVPFFVIVSNPYANKPCKLNKDEKQQVALPEKFLNGIGNGYKK